jgi:hypothetical protein
MKIVFSYDAGIVTPYPSGTMNNAKKGRHRGGSITKNSKKSLLAVPQRGPEVGVHRVS